MNDLLIPHTTLEEAVGIHNPTPFIESNTINCTLEELELKHIIPVFTKDNEAAISQIDFIKTMMVAASNVFGTEYISNPSIRVSHPIKGRIPEARNKPVDKLTEDEKTIYYERMAFIIEIPSIKESIDGNLLNLTIGGVKAYNLDNLNGKYSPQSFKFFIGFKNRVCTNLCISTDGFVSECEVLTIDDLYINIAEQLNQFDLMSNLESLKGFSHLYLKEKELAQILGKTRLYNHLPNSFKKGIPSINLTDTQWNAIARGIYHDPNFKADSSDGIDGWRLYNLMTGANKSSYIDSFLDKGANCTDFMKMITDAKYRQISNWYLN
jgi:hypothetical protein